MDNRSFRIRALLLAAVSVVAVPACQHFESDDTTSRKQQARVVAPAPAVPGSSVTTTGPARPAGRRAAHA